MGGSEGSNKWMYAVRIILVLLGVIQMGFMGWAKWVTSEIIDSKSERVSIQQNIANINENVRFIRERMEYEDRKKH